jgi:hypothetical protein
MMELDGSLKVGGFGWRVCGVLGDALQGSIGGTVLSCGQAMVWRGGGGVAVVVPWAVNSVAGLLHAWDVGGGSGTSVRIG